LPLAVDQRNDLAEPPGGAAATARWWLRTLYSSIC
jgi:hypothetical protein